MIENYILQQIVFVLFGALIIFAIAGFAKKILPKYVKETNNRYRTRKFINYFSYFLFFFLLTIIYSNQLSGLTVFLGIAGAGIAFALQEVIASIAGFIFLIPLKRPKHESNTRSN